MNNAPTKAKKSSSNFATFISSKHKYTYIHIYICVYTDINGANNLPLFGAEHPSIVEKAIKSVAHMKIN